jgi:hypothetical protein
VTVDYGALSAPERLLWFHGCRCPEHIDLEAIACDRGAHVIYRRMDGCAARLLTDGEQAIISIRVTDNEGRRRFSLAHELAHWVSGTCRGLTCLDDGRGPGNAAIEAAADEFASRLVLPDYMVEPWLRGRRVSLALAVELATAFRASVTASALKLARRPGSGVCLVCHSLQGRRWFVRSGNWPPRLYPALQLHPHTAAFELAVRGVAAMANAGGSPGAHWLSGMGSAAARVDAESLRLPDGAVLTMLALPAPAARRSPVSNRRGPVHR